jgi:hypothetical protein
MLFYGTFLDCSQQRSKLVFILFIALKQLLTPTKSEIRDATVSIGPLLKKSVQEEKAHKPLPNWRIHNKNFIKKSSRHICEPGTVNFSAGWLGQGHTVSVVFFYANLTNS